MRSRSLLSSSSESVVQNRAIRRAISRRAAAISSVLLLLSIEQGILSSIVGRAFSNFPIPRKNPSPAFIFYAQKYVLRNTGSYLPVAGGELSRSKVASRFFHRCI